MGESKVITIKTGPDAGTPGVEVFKDLVIKRHLPYGTDHVTLIFSPGFDDFASAADTPEVKVRNLTATSSTDETETREFNFTDKKSHDVVFQGRTYRITLLEIHGAVPSLSFDLNVELV
jgi:hypothetical protein